MIKNKNIEEIKIKFKSGEKLSAIENCKTLIASHPHDPELKKLLAKMYGLQGDYKSAIKAFKKVLNITRLDPETIYNLAYLEREQEHFHEARKWINSYLELMPMDIDGWLKKTEIEFELGEYEGALKSTDFGLEINKNDSSWYLIRAKCLRKLNKLDSAKKNIENAEKLNSNEINILYEKSLILNLLSDSENYLKCCAKIIDIQPKSLIDIYFKANILVDMGDFEKGLELFDLLIENEFKINKILNLKSEIFLKLGRFDECLNILKQAYENNSDESKLNFGKFFYQTRNHNEALYYLDQYLEIFPNDCNALTWKASNLLELNQINDAIKIYSKIIKININEPFIFGQLVHQLQYLCRWKDLTPLFKILYEGLLKKNYLVSPFVAISTFDNPRFHYETAKTYVNFNKVASKLIKKHIDINKKNSKIKIAYISPDFGHHAVSYLAVELFELHNRGIFEVYGISLLNRLHDDFKSRVIKSFDHFIDVSSKSDDDIVRIIRDLNIDIAIDLCGLTNGTRFKIFSIRVAPIQINYLGYLGSMGEKFMDYIIADNVLINENNRDFFSEKIIYLPSYQINDSKRKSSSILSSKQKLCIPSNSFVYGCFNNSYKITEEVFLTWLKILENVPNSYLVLSAQFDEIKVNLHNFAKINNVNIDRIKFLDRVSRDEYLSNFGTIDLFLDTLVYNAGTTASDALWMGIPVITMIGNSFPSRIAASILYSIGLEKLVTKNITEYENLAIELGIDGKKYSSLKDELIKLVAMSKLFDSVAFTKSIESAYKLVYEKHLNHEVHSDFCITKEIF